MSETLEKHEGQQNSPGGIMISPRVEYVLKVARAWGAFIILIYLLSLAITTLTVLPDIDQALLSILHHRSIITHSILIPMLVLLALRNRFPVVQSVLFASFSIHLSADLLSLPVGYGAVWLPAPMKISLGILSPLWLALNAAVALYLSFRRAPPSIRPSLFWSIVLTGLVYGVTNEGNVFSIIPIAIILAATVLQLRYSGGIAFSPTQRLDVAKQEYVERKNMIALAERIRREERAKMGRLKRWVLTTVDAVKLVSRWVSAPFRYPKRTAVFFSIVGLFYFVGLVSGNQSGDEGVVSAVAEGVWVVHSAGGCILSLSTGYVSGTYTSDSTLCH